MTTYAYNIETFSVFKEKVYNKMEKEKNIAFQLKYDLIKNTRYQNFQKDFTFVVNGKEYQTSRFVADLLSPKIGRLHEIDETMCNFSFDTIHEGDFQILLDLVNFEPKNFSTDEIDFLNESLFSLGNVEYLALNPIFNEPITLQNVTLRIQQKLFYKKPLNDQSINYDAYQIITDEISFLASHFYEYADKREEKFEEISKLDVTSISMILNDPALKISNEDSLMLFIIDLFKKNSWQFTEDFIRLMEWVQFENLSNNSMNKFVEVFNLDFMNTQIWTSLIKRLILPRANEVLNSPCNKYDRYRIKQLPLTYGLVNDGVFNYLRSKFNRNPIDSGLVGVTASSSSMYKPDITVTNDSLVFRSDNKPNQWICYHFKKGLMQISDYQITMINQQEEFLTWWVIEISNDGNSWKEIIQNNQEYSKGNMDKNCNYSIGKEIEFARFIRLRQCSNNKNHNILSLCSIEFYGEYVEFG